MPQKPTLILTDNPYALSLAEELQAQHGDIEVRQSPRGSLTGVERLCAKTQASEIIERYGLVISIHCKQLFPRELVEGVRCINVHPGFNPYNRGWFPQVFSILNGLPAGVTIHEIDAKLDHGPIIVQHALTIEPWDTSGSIYERLMALEREMVLKHFGWIRDQPPMTKRVPDGNINYKRDFDALRRLDMAEIATYGEVINRLRALTHEPYANAYFFTDDGRKVYVSVRLEPAPLD